MGRQRKLPVPGVPWKPQLAGSLSTAEWEGSCGADTQSYRGSLPRVLTAGPTTGPYRGSYLGHSHVHISQREMGSCGLTKLPFWLPWQRCVSLIRFRTCTPLCSFPPQYSPDLTSFCSFSPQCVVPILLPVLHISTWSLSRENGWCSCTWLTSLNTMLFLQFLSFSCKWYHFIPHG